jgi:hypothetical protein
MNFARITGDLRRPGFLAEARRFSDERRPVNATELERFVGLNAITLGAAFHDAWFGAIRRNQAEECLNLIHTAALARC